jgi:putative SOS response-associated peptidase YedK
MCGRFTLRTPAGVIAEQFGVLEMPLFTARFNIAPSQPVAVVRLRPEADGAPRRELVMLRWGLVPHWAKDLTTGNRLINARAETLAEKPAFRSALRERRCLVVADGFYEWKREGRSRRPMFFRLRDDRPFAFAGLWERWAGGEQGPLETCTILTTEANDAVRPVHDRMPVILAPDNYASWLDSAIKPESLSAFLRPYPAEEMESVPVGPYVNDARHEGAECVEGCGRVGI